MKKIITLLLLTFIVSTLAFTQALPPNAGFESWITTGNYSNPQSWDTPNATTAAIPFVGASVVTKSSGAHSGSWCAKLENKNFLVATVPGIMTLGTLAIDLVNQNFGLTGGAPYNERPDVFKGFYKYSPQGTDTCAFLAIFYKHNINGGQDTIGIAFYLNDSTKTAWTAFEAPIMWFTNDMPDTVNIIASSAASFAPSAGSVLYVDDLSFDYYTGIADIKPTDAINIDFNRSSKEITVSVDFPAKSDVVTRVINLTGQTVRKVQNTTNGQKNFSISMQDQPRGMYVVEVRAGEIKKVKKIVLN